MAWSDRRGERLTPREILISALGGRCEKCGAAGDLQVHHRVPLAAGGTIRLNILAVLCRACHKEETTSIAKVGRLRGSDRTSPKSGRSKRGHGPVPSTEATEGHQWFEETELFRFDDEAALAHLWMVTAVNARWAPETIQRRHDRWCPITDCPLRGKGVISLIARQSKESAGARVRSNNLTHR